MAKTRKENIDNHLLTINRRSFEEEIQNDREAWEATLNRPEFASDENKEDEKKRVDFLTRVLLCLSSSNMQIYEDNKKGNSEKSTPAQKNKLPVTTYLSHGGRAFVRIPRISDEKETHTLFNWMMTGENKDGAKKSEAISLTRTAEAAKKDNNKIVYNRSISTHAIAFNKNGDPVERKLSLLRSLWEYIKAFFGLETKNWGIDVAIGGYGERDIHGNEIQPNGMHGHVLVYYEPPTKEKDGALLIGIEGSAPLKDSAYGTHSIWGASNPVSIAGGRKLETFRDAHQEALEKDDASPYKNTVIGGRYNGMIGALQKEDITQLVALDNVALGAYRSTLPHLIPQKNFNTFKESGEKILKSTMPCEKEKKESHVQNKKGWVNGLFKEEQDSHNYLNTRR